MPGDTNPIEGSHAQDNQVNHTNRSLLEAILLHVSSSLNDGNISDHFISAREYDQQTARVLKASAEAGILENGNNSLQARFAASSRRQARARTKKAELEMRDGGKHLKAKLKAAERREKEKELEIQKLRAQLSALPVLPSNARQRPQAGPSTCRYICKSFS
jgi:seryl-tRNA synthetase